MPAPVLGTLGSPFDQLVFLELPLDPGELVLERAASGGLVAPREVALGLVEEGRLPEGVVGAVPDVFDEVDALVDLVD